MRVAPSLALAGLLLAAPTRASHDWIGLDLCRNFPERMPPPIEPSVFPEPDGTGARLLRDYCGQCHYPPGPGQHTAGEWADVLTRMDWLMEVTARFGNPMRLLERPDGTEQTLLRAYLQRHALRPLADQGRVPAAYRRLCGDCHALADPAAYTGANWHALLARMADHRRTMGRAPADPVAQAEVAAFLGVPVAGSPPVSGAPGPWQATGDGRWLALGPVFAFVLIGLVRWWRGQARRT
jgi:hypothetical protein